MKLRLTPGTAHIWGSSTIYKFNVNKALSATIRTTLYIHVENVYRDEFLSHIQNFRDELGRGRFWPFLPEDHLKPGEKDPNYWYKTLLKSSYFAHF